MKTVLITGGSRGIGAAMVRRFAAGGYRVAFIYEKAKEQAERLSAETGALAIQADIGVSSEARRAVIEAKAVLGEIGVLINNAAISSFSLFTDITEAAWERIFAVNVNGAFYCTQAVLPEMISRKQGSVINVSSMWGQVGASCEVHYSSTKAALIGMTRALAKEVGPSGITVNCIAPGVIATEMNAALDGETLAALAEETPLGRLGDPAEIAECAYFLSSDGARFITGQVIGVNGGFVI